MLGRPKTYPKFHDSGTFIPSQGADAQTLDGLEAENSEVGRRWLAENRTTIIPKGQRMFARSLASFNDPRCVYIVLDMCIRSAPEMYLRPNQIAEYLQRVEGQYVWSGISVGRVLAGLHQAALMTYGSPAGLVEDYEDDDKYIPFAQGRDGIGRYYVVDPKGGNEGRVWLMMTRKAVLYHAESQMKADMYGNFKEYFGKGTNCADTLMDADYGGWLSDVGPMRSVMAYKAQSHFVFANAASELPADPGIDFSKQPGDGSGVRLGS